MLVKSFQKIYWNINYNIDYFSELSKSFYELSMNLILSFKNYVIYFLIKKITKINYRRINAIIMALS